MKRLLKVSFVLMLMALPVLLYQQSRRFYCFKEGRCVTVWKRIGGVCYIVRFSDVNAGVELMSINIKEGYAEDRFGKKL